MRAIVRNGLLATLFAVAFAVPDSPPARSAPPDSGGPKSVHAILIADTLKGPAGTAASLRSMRWVLDCLREMGCEVQATELEGDRVTPGNITDVIRKLAPGKLGESTLLVYYAGHGGTDPTKGHFLSTPAGPLPRSLLLDEIRAKRPRLALVLSDCCSTEVSWQPKALAMPMVVPPPRKAIEDLLFEHRGVVDINGSSCRPEQGLYQAAFYHPDRGGLFTGAFASMFPDLHIPPFEPIGLGDVPATGRLAHAFRFHGTGLPLHDRNKDGFLEWAEAVDYLNVTLMDSYERFRAEVKSGDLAVKARPRDVATLMAQVSQDPQVFGELARPAGRAPEAQTSPRVERAKLMRFGAKVSDRIGPGGACVEVTEIELHSPATRAFLWTNRRRAKEAVPLTRRSTIIRANNVRVRSRDELLQVLADIPEGGELDITGYDASTNHRTTYQATVVLDRYE